MSPCEGDRLAIESAEKMIAEIRRVHTIYGHEVTFHVLRGFVGGCGGYLRDVWGPKTAFSVLQTIADMAARDISTVDINLPPKE